MRTTPLAAAALLLIVACTGPAGSTPSPSPAPPIAVELADFMITPEVIANSNPAVKIDVSSSGPTPHNLTIRDATGQRVAASKDLRAGEADTIEVTLQPGAYTMFCAFAGHESLGMSGTLTINAP